MQVDDAVAGLEQYKNPFAGAPRRTAAEGQKRSKQMPIQQPGSMGAGVLIGVSSGPGTQRYPPPALAGHHGRPEPRSAVQRSPSGVPMRFGIASKIAHHAWRARQSGTKAASEAVVSMCHSPARPPGTSIWNGVHTPQHYNAQPGYQQVKAAALVMTSVIPAPGR